MAEVSIQVCDVCGKGDTAPFALEDRVSGRRVDVDLCVVHAAPVMRLLEPDVQLNTTLAQAEEAIRTAKKGAPGR